MQQLFRRSLHGLLLKALHLHLHVRLPSTYPHFANHHVVQYDAITIPKDNHIGTAGLWCLDLDIEITVLTGRQHIRLLVPCCQDIDTFSRLSPSPDVTLRLLLQHHIVCKESRQLNFCICCESNKRTDGANPCFHIIALF